VALDRQSIEKKDFPIGRRGYDPDAVDAHLGRLADEVDELERGARRRSETLASVASEQVRAIVEAAESSAAEIRRQAEEEAREIKDQAGGEAQATREQANSQAREYVGKLSESSAMLLKRLEAMEGELAALIESLRTGSNRLNADLQLQAPAVSAGSTEGPAVSASPKTAAVSTASTESFEHVFRDPEPADEKVPASEPAVSAASTESFEHVFRETEAAEESAPARESAHGSDDSEGARLIALNMALNGTPRAETDRYLEENFELSDRRRLLDEVYASVEG
jgi:DivIVA domain-containing protein